MKNSRDYRLAVLASRRRWAAVPLNEGQNAGESSSAVEWAADTDRQCGIVAVGHDRLHARAAGGCRPTVWGYRSTMGFAAMYQVAGPKGWLP